MSSGLVYEKYWVEKFEYNDVERQHYENLSKCTEIIPVKIQAKIPKNNLFEPFWIDRSEFNDAECKYYKKLYKSKKPSTGKKQNDTSLPPVIDEPINICGKTNKANIPIKDSDSENFNKKDNTIGISKSFIENKSEDSIILSEEPCIKNEVIDSEIDKCNIILEGKAPQVTGQYSLASEVAKARQFIKNSLECMDTVLARVPNAEVEKKLNKLTEEYDQLKCVVNDLKTLCISLQKEILILKQNNVTTSAQSQKVVEMKPVSQPKRDDAEDDDGVDLFASDSEDDTEAAKVREQRLAEYAAKKSKKPALIAKSSIILDCKPWDDETDMKAMEEKVRTITADGLLWGASKLVPLAYGINKLQISCVIEDDKISVDWLQEKIQDFEDYVQSVDIAAFNKI